MSEYYEKEITILKAKLTAEGLKYKAFWEQSRLADQEIFEKYVWGKDERLMPNDRSAV